MVGGVALKLLPEAPPLLQEAVAQGTWRPIGRPVFTRSGTRLCSVSSPWPSMIARARQGSMLAFWVARKRLPGIAPKAPRTRAAASPRPSAMPPVASTRVGAARSAAAGTNGNVARRPPWPPASPPGRRSRQRRAGFAGSAECLAGHRKHRNDSVNITLTPGTEVYM